jgi:hypothetical protein
MDLSSKHCIIKIYKIVKNMIKNILEDGSITKDVLQKQDLEYYPWSGD